MEKDQPKENAAAHNSIFRLARRDIDDMKDADSQNKTTGLSREKLLRDFGWDVRNALLGEVYTTPKPGLVDLHDTGAHKDMDHDTFLRSTEAINPYLTEMFLSGFDGVSVLPVQAPGFDPSVQYSEPEKIFLMIRLVGMNAERAMFQATGGVNTHKGIIFTMGILAAAAGMEYREEASFHVETILEKAGEMTRRILEKEFREMAARMPKTHGEILFHQYGEKGIRGQAQEGFPILRETAVPAMRKYSFDNTEKEQLLFPEMKRRGTVLTDLFYPGTENARKERENAANLQVLLEIMAVLNDTNVASRSSYEAAEIFRKRAQEILRMGGAFTQEGMAAVIQWNADCIRDNISPGGAADILASAILLRRLENR